MVGPVIMQLTFGSAFYCCEYLFGAHLSHRRIFIPISRLSYTLGLQL